MTRITGNLHEDLRTVSIILCSVLLTMWNFTESRNWHFML